MVEREPSLPWSGASGAAALAELPGLAQVRQAALALAGKVVRTAVLRCAALDSLARAELWLKAENLQHVGAFKARGALYAIGRLSPEEQSRGVITYSSGNHGQAVARAAKALGIAATVTMPSDAPTIKVDAVRALGAEVVFAGTSSAERKQQALRIQTQTGAVMIPPFDHPDIIAGQGTATLELIEQVAEATAGGELDALLVSVGGGGLLAGACLATSQSGTRVYSVEPVGCDAMARSIEAGERVVLEPGSSIADGLRPVQVGELNFAIAKARLAGVFRVNDEQIARAVVSLHHYAAVTVEPSGAAAAALALRAVLPKAHRRVGVILSGGNIDPAFFASLCERYAPWPLPTVA